MVRKQERIGQAGDGDGKEPEEYCLMFKASVTDDDIRSRILTMTPSPTVKEISRFTSSVLALVAVPLDAKTVEQWVAALNSLEGASHATPNVRYDLA